MENCEERLTVPRECPPLPLGRAEEWRVKLKLLKRNRQLRLFCSATRHDFYALGRRRRNFLPQSPFLSLSLFLFVFCFDKRFYLLEVSW